MADGDLADPGHRVDQPERESELGVGPGGVEELAGEDLADVAVEEGDDDARRDREADGLAPEPLHDHADQPPLGVDDRPAAVPLDIDPANWTRASLFASSRRRLLMEIALTVTAELTFASFPTIIPPRGNPGA